jgi:tRNA(Ile)-lysidine synthase
MPGVSRPPQLDLTALFAPILEFKRVALAVSGGADSLALMLLAHQYAEATNAHERFVVYTVNHGLRPEAADEVAFVVREAARLKFHARVLSWEGDKPLTGVQQAARLARYSLFGQAMLQDKVEAIVTAHHIDDQAETVLMRLAHGSGIDGLRGMDTFSEVGGVTVVRPLLRVDPSKLRAVVATAGLTPVIDPSNSDIDYERVRWRQMLPQLAVLGLDARRLARFAERMRDADGALVSMTAEAMSMVAFGPDDEQASFGRDLLVSVPRAIAVRLVGRVLDRVGGGRRPHALGAVEALTDRLIRERATATLHGCIVRAGGKTIRIEREGERRPTAPRARRKEPSEA